MAMLEEGRYEISCFSQGQRESCGASEALPQEIELPKEFTGRSKKRDASDYNAFARCRRSRLNDFHLRSMRQKSSYHRPGGKDFR